MYLPKYCKLCNLLLNINYIGYVELTCNHCNKYYVHIFLSSLSEHFQIDIDIWVSNFYQKYDGRNSSTVLVITKNGYQIFRKSNFYLNPNNLKLIKLLI